MKKRNAFNISGTPRLTVGKSDVMLITVTAALIFFGVLMVYSAGSYTAERIYGTRFYYVYKQLTGAGRGVWRKIKKIC